MVDPVAKILGNNEQPAYLRAAYLAKKYNLSPKKTQVFVEFVRQSDTFRDTYTTTAYLEEWAKRFAKGKEFNAADLENQRLLAKLDPQGYEEYKRWLG